MNFILEFFFGSSKAADNNTQPTIPSWVFPKAADDDNQQIINRQRQRAADDDDIRRVIPAQRQNATRQHHNMPTEDFIKVVLNWGYRDISGMNLLHHKDHLSKQEFESIPHYYQTFIPFILEETRAMIHEAFNTDTDIFKLKFSDDARIAKNAENPSSAKVTGQLPKSVTGGYAMLMLILKSGPHQVLAIASRAQENADSFMIKFINKDFQSGTAFDADNWFKKNDRWTAYVVGSAVTHERMHTACRNAIDTFGFTRNIVHSTTSAFPQTPVDDAKDFPHLNPEQRAAVLRYQSAKPGLYVLQGPPGTGKTTTIISLLESLIRNRKRVLVCAPSNKAIQVIAKQYFKKNPNAPMWIVGVEEKLDPELMPIFLYACRNDIQKTAQELNKTIAKLNSESDASKHQWSIFLNTATQLIKELQTILNRFRFTNIRTLQTLDTLLNQLIPLYNSYHDESLKWFEANSDTRKKTQDALNAQYLKLQSATQAVINAANFPESFEIELLNTAPIIFSTLSVCGRSIFQKSTKFDDCIVDEASQALEPETAIAFPLIKNRLLLVGDQQQLPATVTSPHALRFGFDQSLMSRLCARNPENRLMLIQQYRMHPEIRRWPSENYYEGRLIDGDHVLKREPLLNAPPHWLQPWSFYDVKQGQEEKMGTSWCNKLEAQSIAHMINFLRSMGVNCEKSVGIITFYTGQVDLLKNSIDGKDLPTIHSVDGFQGGERDIIIISFVRSNHRANVGFLKDFRRLNVAVTRGKHHMLMFGHKRTLQNSNSDLTILINEAEQRKLIFNAPTEPIEAQTRRRDEQERQKQFNRRRFFAAPAAFSKAQEQTHSNIVNNENSRRKPA